MKLSSDRLARHQASLSDKQSALRVKRCDSENYLLCSVLKSSLLPLFEKSYCKAYTARTEALTIISILKPVYDTTFTYEAYSDDEIGVPRLPRSLMVASQLVKGTSSSRPVHPTNGNS